MPTLISHRYHTFLLPSLPSQRGLDNDNVYVQSNSITSSGAIIDNLQTNTGSGSGA